EPTVGLDHLDVRPAAKQMHLCRTCLQCGRGIVEGRGAGADHCNLFAAEAGEVDRLRRMHAKRRRQMAQRPWNGPIAHTFLPRREHNLARKNIVDTGRGLDLGREQPACRRRDLDELAAIAHRKAHDAPEPDQILRPKLTRNKVEISPIVLPEPRLVPRLVGQAGNIKIGAGEILRTAQRMHAGISKPWSFSPLLGFVQHKDVGHLRAHQPKSRSETRLAGADHKQVQCRPAVRRLLGRKPRGTRVRGLGKIGTNLGFESDKSVVHAASQPPSTTMTVPVVKEDASLARWSAASATSSALPNRLMACRLRDASHTGSGSAWRAKLRCSIGVSMAPGAIALTRIPSVAKSSAIVRVRLMI